MTWNRANPPPGLPSAEFRWTLSTIAFAAISDHERLPWRFFGRLHASEGSLGRG